MGKLDGTIVEVLNWEKYNPRGDVKRPSWFRLDNDIATGPTLFGLNCEYKFLWITILCESSRKNGQPLVWNASYVEAVTGIVESRQFEALEIFRKKGFISTTRDVRVTDAGEDVTRAGESGKFPCATNERTNGTERDGTNGTPRPCENETLELLPDESSRVPRGTSRGCITEFGMDDVALKLLEDVSVKLQHAWVQAYGDPDWILQEIRKANAWMEANPRKRPKNFGPFMNNWLSKGWESYRKGIPSRRMTNSELNAQSLAEMAQKVAEGKL